MDEIVSYTEELQELESATLAALKDVPPGRLEITGTQKKRNYYWVFRQEDKKYKKCISTKDSEFIQKLAQKSYNQTLLHQVKKELKLLQPLLKNSDKSLEQIYETMSDQRKKIVIPYRITDQQFTSTWLEIPNPGNPVFAENLKHETLNQEFVRSKSERSIADALFQYGIPYKYENPLFLRGLGTIHPDFSILDVKNRRIIYWEHFGKVEDSQYMEKTLTKINAFVQNGYVIGKDFIYTMETLDSPLSQSHICKMIENHIL